MPEAIKCSEAPDAIGPYSQAVLHNGMLYVSGQLGFLDNSGELATGIQQQAEQIFSHIERIARQGGSSLDNAVKLTLYLTDLSAFGAVNQLMEHRLKPPYPARATVEVAALPRGAAIEIDAIIAC